jgi:NADPH:quinone reductase
MKAFTLDGFDAVPGLRDDLPEPTPATGELVVAVKATSVNPVDLWVASGGLRAFAPYRFPVTLGRDFAGVVEQGAGEFSAGDEVFGFVPASGPEVQRGAWAERIAVPGDLLVARKPATLSMAEAGAAALAGVTALLCVEALRLEGGERVLIVGASGGVGAFCVQLCVRSGATVIAPALAIDREFLAGLGAAEVPARGTVPEGVDALIDLVSADADSFAANAATLEEGGAASSALPGIGTGERRHQVAAVSDPTGVARLGELIDAEGLGVPICEAFGFGELGAALTAMGEHKQGKLSVV